ncbi:DNA polymerase IV [Desulforamulus hydrothermalis]|uniref:DNA polymerase IV n=1 Tax=Desulforamulus hydrothermalis Lam5 = DSM 18033 TaxID=1121428 RepID=K8EKH8_9FIRM|nr:DNA polymerase IV [Desulforamulus hydrothermalis]CCO09056.1 DNA polymerase IV [Desulforamulus hydrothermalis Lam5 = DSM 18033]SHG78041.1 DNA polymerase-4 [Desulforamulus hydrothermalis Lam5 = DSM 18033]
MSRTILLCDMNSFYASVHQAMDAGLRGRPVIVAGDPANRTGIVLAASYEAKQPYGIKTGMLVTEAKALCPRAVFVAPAHRHYVAFASRINNILRDFSDLVEPFSIDESFLDVTGCLKLFGSPQEIARQIQRRINQEVGVGVNIGIGPSKLVAKMAAEMEKPNKIITLTREDWPHKVWPLPVKELFGVGTRIGKWLNQIGVQTIGQLAALPVALLKKRYGLVGEVLHYAAHGIDHSPVDPGSMEVIKSVGNQITLPRDYRGYDQIKVVIMELAEEVTWRARKAGYLGNRVSLTIRTPDFYTETHARVLPAYTDITGEVYEMAVFLLKKHWSEDVKARLVGLTLAGLVSRQEKQLDLLCRREKQEKIDRAADLIRSRWGQHSIKRAVSLTDSGVYYGR